MTKKEFLKVISATKYGLVLWDGNRGICGRMIKSVGRNYYLNNINIHDALDEFLTPELDKMDSCYIAPLSPDNLAKRVFFLDAFRDECIATKKYKEF